MKEVECRKCAMSAIGVLSGFDMLNDRVSFYGKSRFTLHEMELEQIDTLRKLLSSELGETIVNCGLPPESPIAKVKVDLDKAGDIEAITWAIQNFEGALYQSLST